MDLNLTFAFETELKFPAAMMSTNTVGVTNSEPMTENDESRRLCGDNIRIDTILHY